jgi:hypothetical protein
LWPWGSGVESRFGWIHIECLQRRLSNETLCEIISNAFREHAQRVAEAKAKGVIDGEN